MSDTETLPSPELDAAVLRKLLAHLDKRRDVQNIDLMNLAGFCRNCLARWYQEAAEEQGQEMDKSTARQRVYGMPYEAWQQQQPEATADQLARLERVMADPDLTS